jgi:hypothetical protein
MSYEIKLTAIVKTFGKNLTHSQMKTILNNALWASEDFRDVQIIDYQGDTLEDPKTTTFQNPFFNLKQSPSEES